MSKRTIRLFLTTQGTPVTIDGDLEIDITDGILTVRDYDKRSSDVTNGIVFSAAKGFWASVGVVEAEAPDGE